MSDCDVLNIIDEMEILLKDEGLPLDPDRLMEWQQRFSQAIATAERGEQWKTVTGRAQAVNALLEHRLSALVSQRDSIKRELEGQAVGQRALKAYSPN
jgi:hypothetical protein